MDEEPLPGGFVTEVVRVGNTVRRRPAERAAYVRLTHFARHGWPGAPRHLGTDEQGREVLSYLDGHVAWQPDQPPTVGDDESLAAMARLIREFHDLTAGTPLAEGDEVVCHNDLSPKNTVYRPRPVAFIDWDTAAPGRRVHDVAHACRQFCGPGPEGPGPDGTGRRMAVVCERDRAPARLRGAFPHPAPSRFHGAPPPDPRCARAARRAGPACGAADASRPVRSPRRQGTGGGTQGEPPTAGGGGGAGVVPWTLTHICGAKFRVTPRFRAPAP